MCFWPALAILEEGWKVSECYSWPNPCRLQEVEKQDLHKHPGWSPVEMTLQGGGDRQAFFKPSQIITYLPTVWRSGKLHAVTSSPLGITSVRVELLIPHSGDRDLESKSDMWSTLFGIVVTANSSGREFGMIFCKSVCSWAGLWHISLWIELWFSMLSRVWDLALAKEHTHTSRAWRCCSSVLHIMEFYWSGSEAWAIIPKCLGSHPFISQCTHLFILLLNSLIITNCVTVSKVGRVTRLDCKENQKPLKHMHEWERFVQNQSREVFLYLFCEYPVPFIAPSTWGWGIH